MKFLRKWKKTALAVCAACTMVLSAIAINLLVPNPNDNVIVKGEEKRNICIDFSKIIFKRFLLSYCKTTAFTSMILFFVL